MKLFPANNVWNTPVDTLPVHANSANWISVIQRGAGTWNPEKSWLRCDDVMPLNFVSGATLFRPVGLWPEADPGLYACPPTAVGEGDGTGDVHMIIVQDGMLYEFYSWAHHPSQGDAMACKWDLNSNAMRPNGLTSCDAGGLPVAAGVARYEEIEAGEITHALRFTASRTNETYLWPARHYARVYDPAVPVETRPQMGMRVRLKASFDISGYPPQAQIILRGLKKYGCMLADNGMPWGMQHDQDPRWSFDQLITLHNVMGTNMEVVDSESLMVNYDSMMVGEAAGCVMMTDKLARPNITPIGAGLSIVGGKLTATGGGAVRANIAPLQAQVAANVQTEGAATQKLEAI